MLYPSIMKLTDIAGSRYSLVIAASKRARKILEKNANEDSSLDGAKSITIAVNDIANGAVQIINDENNEQYR